MPSRSKLLFDTHIHECEESIAIHEHLERSSGFKADFSLRFVWIAAVSALDHYISQLILEKATISFGNGIPLQGKLLSDLLSFSNALELRAADPVKSVLVFRKILSECIRYKSFQHPDKISEGLSYIWGEKHKWQHISNSIGIDESSAKKKLSSIIDRRNLIAHNADFDEGRGSKLGVIRSDATEAMDFITLIVDVIDREVA